MTNDISKYGTKISKPCTLEPQMGNCTWGYSPKHNKYMCSICGKEFAELTEYGEQSPTPVLDKKTNRKLLKALNDIFAKEVYGK